MMFRMLSSHPATAPISERSSTPANFSKMDCRRRMPLSETQTLSEGAAQIRADPTKSTEQRDLVAYKLGCKMTSLQNLCSFCTHGPPQHPKFRPKGRPKSMASNCRQELHLSCVPCRCAKTAWAFPAFTHGLIPLLDAFIGKTLGQGRFASVRQSSTLNFSSRFAITSSTTPAQIKLGNLRLILQRILSGRKLWKRTGGPRNRLGLVPSRWVRASPSLDIRCWLRSKPSFLTYF